MSTEISEKELIENLMRPRYKCLIKYPRAAFSINEIVTNEDFMFWNSDESIENYPDVFKRLDWVEGRQGQDWLPNYIYRMYEGRKLFYKLIEISEGVRKYKLLPELEIGLLSYLGHAHPCTEQDYLSFINQNKQQ